MQQAKSLTVFDKGDGGRIRQSLLEYERADEAEWPLVANGQTYPEADAALQRLYAAYQQTQPRNETQQKVLVVALNNLDKMSAERTERLTVARTDTGPPWSLWMVNFLTSGMVLGCAIVFGGKNSAMHYTMVAVFGRAGRKHPVPNGGAFSPVPRRDFDLAGAATRGHPVSVATAGIVAALGRRIVPISRSATPAPPMVQLTLRGRPDVRMTAAG